MGPKMEKIIEKGYGEYSKLPLATEKTQNENEVYNNGWCIFTGRPIASPPYPHRHYTLDEFFQKCLDDEIFEKRFIKKDNIAEEFYKSSKK